MLTIFGGLRNLARAINKIVGIPVNKEKALKIAEYIYTHIEVSGGKDGSIKVKFKKEI